MQLYSTLIFICIALLCSLTIYFRQNVSRYLRLFPLFLLIAAIVEFVSAYLVAHGRHNTTLLDPATTLYICFYLFILSRIIHNRTVRKILVYVIILYPVICAVNILFFQKPPQFHNLTYSLGGFLIAVFCVFYFLELFTIDHTGNLLKEPSFWICTALLLFFTFSFFLYGFIGIYGSNNSIRDYLYVLFDVSDVLLYSLLSIAFLCTVRLKSSS